MYAADWLFPRRHTTPSRHLASIPLFALVYNIIFLKYPKKDEVELDP